MAPQPRTEMSLNGWVLVTLFAVAIAVAFNIGAGLIELPRL